MPPSLFDPDRSPLSRVNRMWPPSVAGNDWTQKSSRCPRSSSDVNLVADARRAARQACGNGRPPGASLVASAASDVGRLLEQGRPHYGSSSADCAYWRSTQPADVRPQYVTGMQQ